MENDDPEAWVDDWPLIEPEVLASIATIVGAEEQTYRMFVEEYERMRAWKARRQAAREAAARAAEAEGDAGGRSAAG